MRALQPLLVGNNSVSLESECELDFMPSIHPASRFFSGRSHSLNVALRTNGQLGDCRETEGSLSQFSIRRRNLTFGFFAFPAISHWSAPWRISRFIVWAALVFRGVRNDQSLYRLPR